MDARRSIPVVCVAVCLAGLLSPDLRSQETPEGFKIMPLPIVSYNSDLGVQFGATAEMFFYGKNPTLYPDYRHRIHFETSYYTGGRGLVHGEYDSSHLIKGIRVFAAASYETNPLHSFYGFGGDVTEYDRDYDKRNGVSRYTYNRQMVRFLSSFEGRISEHIQWVAGLSFWHFNTSDTDYKDYKGDQTLYHYYRKYGIIADNEVSGNVLEFKAGLAWDSRDFEPSPTKGISADLYINASPDIFRTGYAYAKLCAHFRHYFTPGPDWLTFAYHLAFQGTIAGQAPFFMQQNIYSLVMKQAYSDGLGGLNTIRGVLSGRLVGNGYAWGNVEARIRLFKLKLLGMEWSVSVNPFYDCGAIVQPYKIKEIAAATGESEEELTRRSSTLHQSAGLGFKLGIDKNYILSIEAAKPFNRNDNPGFSIACAINYIF